MNHHPLPLPVPTDRQAATAGGYVAITDPYNPRGRSERQMLVNAWSTLKGTKSVLVPCGGGRLVEIWRHQSEIKRSPGHP